MKFLPHPMHRKAALHENALQMAGMFNNSSHIDARYSTFSEVHRDQYYNGQATVLGNQMIHTVVHGNQILQGYHSSEQSQF